MEHKILVAEDDADIAGLLRIYLENSGYSVLIAENGVEALELLRQNRVSLAILDVMMPKMDGFTLTGEIRKISNIPLIILSAKGKEEDRVHGLEIGADIYMTKPFQPGELVAQVQASLRRFYQLGGNATTDGETVKRLRIGDLCIDLEHFTLSRNGLPIPVTATELKILLKMMKSPGRVFTKSQLYQAITGEDGMKSDDNTMMVHISNLREKIEEDPRHPQYIKTIRGIGYKFDGKEKNES